MSLGMINSFHSVHGKVERDIMLVESPNYPIFVLSHTQRRRVLWGVPGNDMSCFSVVYCQNGRPPPMAGRAERSITNTLP